MLLFLTLVNLLNYLDRYVAAGVLPRIIDQFAISKEQAGYVVSAFVIGYVIFSPLFGYLGDRYHRARLMSLGVILWSVATVFAGVVNSFWALVLCRVLVGVGEASYGTIGPAFLKDRFEDTVKLNKALAIFFAAIPVGSALGYVLGGHIASIYSWQASFLICGAPGIILGVILFFLKDERRHTSPPEPFGQGIKAIFSTRILYFAIGGYVLNSFALNAVAAFIANYGEEIGFTLSEITTSFGLILVCTGLVGTLGGGWLSTRFASRSSQPITALLRFNGIASLCGLPFLAAAFMVQDKTIFLLCCTLAEVFIFATTAPINSVLVQSAPRGFTTLTQGVAIFTLNLLGSLPAPILVGFIADRVTLGMGMQLASVALLGSAFVWWAGGRRQRG